jgi:chemotaxis signal transduction protein
MSGSQQQQMALVWSERARRLSQRVVPPESGQNSFPVITLGLGNERYGLELSDVAEVLAPLRVTPVPGAVVVFSGVINVHGEIRPVLDLRRWVGMGVAPEPLAGEAQSSVILLRKGGREMGLQVDSVEQIRWIGPGALQTSGNGAAAASPRFKGTTKDLLMMLSTEALFAELQEGVTK